MIHDTDFGRFTEFLISIGQTTPQGAPSPEKIKGYFMLLDDLDFETVRRNTIQAVKEKGFFPMISDIRRTEEKKELAELEAQKAWDMIERVMHDYYYPGFSCSLDIVFRKLDEMKRPDLKSYISTFGLEIVNQINMPATRAQFLKNFKAQKAEKRLELEQCEKSSEKERLPPRIAGLLEKIGN